jgi:hypothetical protein
METSNTAPKVHKTFFGRTIGKAFDAVKKAVSSLFGKNNKNLLQAVILVTNSVKTVLESPVTGLVVEVTPTGVDDKLLAIANEWVPKILAEELLLQQINTVETEAEVKEIFIKAINTFGKLTDQDREQLYTTLAAKLYIIYNQVQEGKKVTFGQAATLVEEAFQAWVAYKNSK